MPKNQSGWAGDLPYAELIIRPADSRPAVITLSEMGGQPVMSAGSSDDAAEAIVILAMMASVVRSLGIVRLLKELHPPGEEHLSPRGDDIPF